MVQPNKHLLDDPDEIIYVPEYTPSLFHGCDSFYRGIMGPVGSGSSTACVMELWTRAHEQKPHNNVRRTRFAIVRRTYPELISTSMKTWREWVPESICHISMSAPITGHCTMPLHDGTILDMEVIFLALAGPDDIEKLKSLELTMIWFNEACEIDHEVIVMAGTRVDRYPSPKMGGCTFSGVIMDTNPPDEESWWHNLAEEEKPETYTFFQQPPSILPVPKKNPNDLQMYVPNTGQIPGILPAENVANHNSGYEYWMRMVHGAKPGFIKTMLEGKYGSSISGKPIYPSYNDDVHCPTDENTGKKKEIEVIHGLPLLLGFDFGLCYSDDTEVLTYDGWKLFADVDAERDQVATRDPSDGSFQYSKINFKVDKPYKGKMLEWDSQNVNFCVTPEHRVPFSYRDSPEKIDWASAQWLADHMSGHHYVDLVSEWLQPDDDVDRFGMSPDNFAEFMGIYLSEGCVDKKYNRISIYQKEPDGFFTRILSETGYKWKRHRWAWRASDADLASFLRLFEGKAAEKRIPQEIKMMSARQIKLFINAYTAGDGHIRIRPNRSIEHTLFSVSPTMAADMQELAQKAGWYSSVRRTKGQISVIKEDTAARCIYSDGGYCVTFKKKAKRAELLKRNFKEIDYDGRIYCLNVPHHTLYVRRKGRPSWNGNTPTMLIAQQTKRGQLRLIDEVVAGLPENKRKNMPSDRYVDDMAARKFASTVAKPYLMNMYPGFKWITICDPAGNDRNQANEITCLQELIWAGFPAEMARTNLFAPRRQAVEGFLGRMTDGLPSYQISRRCIVLRKGMQGAYKFRQVRTGTGIKYSAEAEKNMTSHVNDAQQYIAMYAEQGGVSEGFDSPYSGGSTKSRGIRISNAKGWT